MPVNKGLTDKGVGQGHTSSDRNAMRCGVSCARATRGYCSAWIAWRADDLRHLAPALTKRGVEQDPMLRPALVLKQQRNLEFATAAGDSIRQIRAVFAQILPHLGILGDLQGGEVDLDQARRGGCSEAENPG